MALGLGSRSQTLVLCLKPAGIKSEFVRTPKYSVERIYRRNLEEEEI